MTLSLSDQKVLHNIDHIFKFLSISLRFFRFFR